MSERATSLLIFAVVFIGVKTASASELSKLTLAEAVSIALTKSFPLQTARQNTKTAQGAALQARGQFDLIVDTTVGYQRRYTPFTPDISQLDNTLQFQLGASKQLPFGLSIESSVGIFRRDSVIPAVVSGTVAPQNIGVVRLQLRQPILRGFGNATSAQADATKAMARAAEHEARFVAAAQVAQVAQAYWDWVGASQRVLALTESEARAEKLVRETRALVKADQRPQADLQPLEGTLADRTRARMQAEQNALSARYALGLQMGLSAAEIEKMKTPLTPLPKTTASLSPLSKEQRSQALAQRSDVEAARIRLEATRILVERAENSQLPELDLIGEVGYAGIVEGAGPQNLFQSLGANIPGLNAGVSLALRWPVERSTAKGEHLQALAAKRRAEIAHADLERRATAGLTLAHQNLGFAERTLAKAVQASSLYRQAVDSERTKLKSGLSTLIDVIVTDDRTTSTALSEVQSRVIYARALAQLAFEAAALIKGEGEALEVDLARLAAP